MTTKKSVFKCLTGHFQQDSDIKLMTTPFVSKYLTFYFLTITLIIRFIQNRLKYIKIKSVLKIYYLINHIIYSANKNNSNFLIR
jgi:hypothetical protein